MRAAFCTRDDTSYLADTFDAKPASWIATNRTMLECVSGQAPAFFRKRSKSGQAACFGARPHADGCKLATNSPEETERAEAVEKFILNNPGQHFLLTLRLPKPPAPKQPSNDPALVGQGNRAGAHTKWGDRQESSSSIGAKECLINLALVPSYRESTTTIALTRNSPAIAVKDFFIRFVDASAADTRVVHGFWGTFTNARPTTAGSPTLWLNTGGREHLSVLVEKDIQKDLLAAYGLDGIEDLMGAWVLIVDELQEAKSTKKLYLKPDKAAKITLYFPKNS